MRYVSQPQEVEAIQWTGDNLDAIQWTGDNLDAVEAFGVAFRYASRWEHPLTIKAGTQGAQGYVPVPVGHWIVRNPDDFTDHWPVDPDYFAAKYEPAAHHSEGLGTSRPGSVTGDDIPEPCDKVWCCLPQGHWQEHRAYPDRSEENIHAAIDAAWERSR